MADSAQADRLAARWNAVAPAIRAAIKHALELSANDLVAYMKALVPKETGALRDSIGWTWGTDIPDGAVALDSVGDDGDDFRITIYAGSREAFYARWVEFGTVDQPAHAFFFPAYRLKKAEIKRRITRAINKATRDAWAGRI